MKIEDSDEPNFQFEPKRASVRIAPGEWVRQGESIYRIEHVLDSVNAICVDVQTGRSASLRIAELRGLEPTDDPRVAEFRDIAAIDDKDWQKAVERLEAIRPLLTAENLNRQQVELRAQQLNVDVSTLYRWIKRYNTLGVTSALVPLKRGWGAGKSRLDRSQDAIISEVIQGYYLTEQRPSVEKTVQDEYSHQAGHSFSSQVGQPMAPEVGHLLASQAGQ